MLCSVPLVRRWEALECDGLPPTQTEAEGEAKTKTPPQHFSPAEVAAMDCDTLRRTFGIVPAITYGILPSSSHW